MERILISILAGLLAGLGTGFAGLSAAVFIAPMLITFLHVDSFSAIGIALASDVPASTISALIYHKHGNTELRRSRVLIVTVLLSAVLGTVFAHFFTGLTLGESFMRWWLILATLVLGSKLLVFPSKTEPKGPRLLSVPDAVVMVVCGLYIGFVCGFQGTGGGLMLLFVLNVLLHVDFLKSVGTSVSIMAGTALIGAFSHFTLRGMPDGELLSLCIASTLAGAWIAAFIANRVRPVTLKRLTGGLMVSAAVAMILTSLL